MERTWVVDVVWIGLALLLVAANGFFVAAEFALVKVRGTRLAHMVREGRAFARTAEWLARRLDRSLSACQLGITMASLALGWIGEPAVAHLLEPAFNAAGITRPALVHGLSFAIGFTIITAAHLVLGEQAPKIFAIRRPEEMALWCAAPLKVFYIGSYPLLRSLDAATSAILRRVGAGDAKHETPHTEEELRLLLGHARAHGELSRTEHRLVEAVFEFDDTVCRQIMVPRTEVASFDVDAPLAETLGKARASTHTRYPVCRGSLDNVLGILHVKDLVGVSAGDGLDIRTILRPAQYVPETMSISRLLTHFQSTRQHMALVVDEYGVVAGIVTLENVLEEIVGAVQDEFDAEAPDVVTEAPGQFVVHGGVLIEDAARLLDTPLEAPGVDTVAGLVLYTLGRVPVAGDRVDLGGASAEVIKVDRKRAVRIRLARRSPEEAAEALAPAGDARAEAPDLP